MKKYTLNFENTTLRKEQNDYQPYLGLANIYYFIGEAGQAQDNLRMALALNPQLSDDVDPQLLEQYFQLESQSEPLELYHPVTKTTYQKMKRTIQKAIEKWSQMLKVMPPSEDPELIEQWQTLNQELQDTIAQLYFQMHSLEQKTLHQAFSQMLQPLEELQKRLQNTLTTSLKLQNIASLIKKLNHLAKVMVIQKRQAQTICESEFQQLLENCYWIGDRLDDFCDRGINVYRLECKYDNLMKWIKFLQA